MHYKHKSAQNSHLISYTKIHIRFSRVITLRRHHFSHAVLLSSNQTTPQQVLFCSVGFPHNFLATCIESYMQDSLSESLLSFSGIQMCLMTGVLLGEEVCLVQDNLQFSRALFLSNLHSHRWPLVHLKFKTRA